MPSLPILRPVLAILLAAGLAACSGGDRASRLAGDSFDIPDRYGTPALRSLVATHARREGVPLELVHRVVMRESRYNPAARNGPYWGLMQIHPQTARTMGFRGEPRDLLDPDTNLRYAVRYLRGAWLVADGDMDRAVMWYARGYYYEARDRGMLEVTGLR